jgi:hypothetical protein
MAGTHRLLPGVLAILAATAACGTTVPIQGTASGPIASASAGPVALGAGNGSGLGAPAATAADNAGNSQQAPRSVSHSATDANRPGGGPATGHDSAGANGTPGLPVAGVGFTAKTLSIGVTTNKDAQAALNAVGISSGPLGDQEAMVKAVLSDINAQGGVLGRHIAPVFHDVKTTETSSNPEGAAQAACSAFTEDTQVAAALELVLDSRLFAECMVKHRAFVVSNGLTFTDKTYVRGLTPNFFRLTSPLAERLVPTLLGRMTALGYFSPWDNVNGRPGKAPVNVGLFYLDEPAPTRVFNNMAARLQRAGYKVTRYAYSRQDSSYQNAVLKFQSSGVTHVIGDNGSYILLMRETQTQGYYPRYGLTSYNGGAILLQGNVPSSALAGALGVGWVPTVDVDAAHDPGSTGPAYSACIQTMHKHGVDISTRSALAWALGICDGLKVLTQSMQAGSGFDGSHITAGRARFSFQSTVSFSNENNEGRIDMPSAVRDYGYQSGCSCFVYLSNANRSLD